MDLQDLISEVSEKFELTSSAPGVAQAGPRGGAEVQTATQFKDLGAGIAKDADIDLSGISLGNSNDKGFSR